MNHNEILKLYTNTLKLTKPPIIKGKPDLPTAIMYYLLKKKDKAYCSEITSWMSKYTSGNFMVNSRRISQLINKRRDMFGFVKRSDERVSRSGNECIHRKYAYQYSLDFSFLEVSK